jgi:hypothetical protein
MPKTEQLTPENDLARLCDRCGARELRRRTRTLADRLFSLQPYQCERCSARQKEFRFQVTVVVRFVILLGLIGGAAYLVLNVPSLSFRNKEAAPSGEAEALARARAGMGGQLSTFEQMMTKKPKGTLDNATVLQLWKAKVGANVILQMIRTSNADYDLSAGSIIALRQAEVDQSIILAMIDTSYSSR